MNHKETKSFSFVVSITILVLLFAVGCSSKPSKSESHKVTIGTMDEAQPAQETASKDEPPKAIAWNYTSKSNWADLSQDYVLCGKGLEQSPVDLRWSKPIASREIAFYFVPGVFQVESHPQKLQLTFAKGSHTMIDGKKWNLVAMQVHTPSEHSFSKKKFPLEVHLVHYDEEESRLGIVAVLFKAGRPNIGIETLLKHLPEKRPGRIYVEDYPLNPSLFLPLTTTHYSYQGSLTYPPCTEGVAWNVLNTPVEISEEQLGRLRKALDPNARTQQQLNHRRPMNYSDRL
jgi:carbonic anhydrase